MREGPYSGPSIQLSYTFFTRRSTSWTFRTTEGIPSRGTPLRFAPFRPLPFRNAPSDDVAAVGPSPYPRAGVHKPPGGYPFRRPLRPSVITNRLIHNHLHTIPRSKFERGISASCCVPGTYRSPWTIASYNTPQQGWPITHCVSSTS